MHLYDLDAVGRAGLDSVAGRLEREHVARLHLDVRLGGGRGGDEDAVPVELIADSGFWIRIPPHRGLPGQHHVGEAVEGEDDVADGFHV